MSDPIRPRPSRLPHLVILAVFAVTGLAACFELSGARAPVARQRWWQDRGPVVPHDSFPADCSTCHTSSSWEEIRDDFSFDHLAMTGVVLNGAHDEAECLRCHNDRGPAGLFAARGCVGCHEDIHQSQLGSDCAKCHSEQDWSPVGQLAEHSRTRFPLVGAHAAAACFACHENAQVGRFDRADTACVSCHVDDLARAASPDHLLQGWTDGCDRCHVPLSWEGAGFQHAFFPLIGGHALADCNACHQGGVFAGTPNDCASCHTDDYDATTDPMHLAAGFPMTCEQCHTPLDWGSSGFSHAFFPLTGAHASTDCNACHQGGSYVGTPTSCVGCHLDQYMATNDPDHMASGFGTNCEQCHDTSGWDGAVFDHSGFPLTGAHVGADCTACHQGGVTAGTPSDCFACHQSDYDGTNDPNHANAGFPIDCEQCHDTSGWDGAIFDHKFPITSGAHKNLDCMECHVVPGNSSLFTCTDCHKHQQTDMDNKHDEENGYSYNTLACYECHPDGKEH